MKRQGICVICGRFGSVTDDHLPPKGIFRKPRPVDLVTVKTCTKCNSSTEKEDEAFKVFMGLVAGHSLEGQKDLEEPVSSTLTVNKRMTRDLSNAAKDVWVKTRDGLALRKRIAVPLDRTAHDIILEKTIRGLHFHHTGKVLADNATVRVYLHAGLNRQMYEMVLRWDLRVIGNGQFIYRYLIPDDEPYTSIWMFQFFNSAWSSGTVLPKQCRMSNELIHRSATAPGDRSVGNRQ